MSQPARIYLDNAATSWPKPESVYAAVDRYQRQWGAPAGRSTYREAVDVESQIAATRRAVARWLGCEEARQVVLTSSGTDSLNLAIHGSLSSGDHVITTIADHNSVLRPLRQLEQAGTITVTRLHGDADGIVDPDDLRAAITPTTAMIAMTHASNVTGALQPAAEIGRIARERDVLFLLDAAQSLGHIPLVVEDLNVDFLAAPGHKGLLGPLGTGLLYVRPGREERLQSTRQGGTGTQSESDAQPETMPEKYESGNLNVPGILGLGAGVEYLRDRGIEAIRQHDRQLTERLITGLASLDGVTLHGPPAGENRLGVVSLSFDEYDPQEAAAMLDAAHRVQTRPGLHCAPLMHRALGTAHRGGTLRLSPGPFTTPEEIDVAIEAIGRLLSASLTT